MFGYITIDKPEMKFRDYDVYRSYYCGLCRKLYEGYGMRGRMTLGYDMTFLVILLSGLYDTETRECVRRCAAHPFHRHRERQNEFTDYAADMNVLLFYYKCLDDWKDDRNIVRGAAALLLSGKVKKISRRYPQKSENIRRSLRELSELEQRGQSGAGFLDETAGTFGKITSEIFAFREDVWEETLRHMGFYLGKFIYLMDAYDDIGEDIGKGRFNVFAPFYGREDFDARCGSVLKMMIAECSEQFERLPVIENAEILRNILYAGVWSKYEAAVRKRTLQKRKEGTEYDDG